MPIEQKTVPIPPQRAPTLHEDEFNATLFGSTPRQAGSAFASRYDEASRNVRWPSDGGLVTRFRTAPWEGASALYFDFRLNDDLRVRLEPGAELLLTFFLEGAVRGQVGCERGPALDFHIDRALLRTPNRAGGFLIQVPGGCRNHFVQFRLRRELLPRWLHGLGVRLPARQIGEMVERDDGHVLCNAALTPRVRACLTSIRDMRAEQPAFVPLFHARAMELLTYVLLDIDQLLKRARSGRPTPEAQAAEAAGRVRTLVAGSPAYGWSVAELARHIGCSSARLQRQIREATGQSVYRLIVAERLQLAARLLRETGLGIQAIATETGWECHGRFSTAFRAAHGMGPREYRLRRSQAQAVQ